MPVTTPPSISALPTAPDPSDRTTFNARAYAWSSALPTMNTELAALAANVFDNATDAAASATAAATQVGIATTQAGDAATQAGIAATQAGNAQTSATNAALSEINAAASAATATSAPGTSATSTTSLAVGLGSKSLTIETGKSLVVGMSVKIANTATPTTWMHGDITSYNSGTGALVVNVTTINGSGTLAAWTVSISAPAGVSTYPKQAVQDKTAAYTVALSDHATTIRTTSGTGDITLLASASAGVGFSFNYENETTAVRYITRAGSDTFQGGETSIAVPPGGAVTIACATASASGKWKVMSASGTGNGANSLAWGSGIASGQGSIAFGANGTATASALGTISMGSGTANANYAMNFGSGSATGQSAIQFGSSTASGQDAFAVGPSNQATGSRSYASGIYGLADFTGKRAHGAMSPRGASWGYSQYARTVLSAWATATSTNYVLTADNSGTAGAANIINVAASRLVTFHAIVSAGRLASSGSEAAGWEVKGVIRRGNTGSVAFVGTPTVTSLGGTVPTGWTLTATADTTNHGLALTFNMGATAMGNVYVSATVHAAEVAI